MPRPAMDDQERALADARRRTSVLVGLVSSIVEKGYAGTTIADIAAHGRVSKSAVYDLFGDKETVFLELYGAANRHVVEVISTADASAVAQGLSWELRLRLMLRNYFATMLEGGAVTRTLLAEAPAISPAGFDTRIATINGYVDLFASIGQRIVDATPGLAVPSRAVLTILVGGMHELMLHALAEGAWDLDQLADAGTGVLAAALGAASPHPANAAL